MQFLLKKIEKNLVFLFCVKQTLKNKIFTLIVNCTSSLAVELNVAIV